MNITNSNVDISEYVVDLANEFLSSIDGAVYSKNGDTLIYVPGKAYGDFVIPEGVKTIQSYAFRQSNSFDSLTLPNSLETIERWAFALGSFNGAELRIPASVLNIETPMNYGNFSKYIVSPDNQRYADIDGVLYDKIDKKILGFPNMKSDTLFEVPYGITEVCSGSLAGADLESIVIPDTVKVIGDSIIWKAQNQVEVILPETIETIGDNAFETPEYGAVIDHIPASVKMIGESAFRNTVMDTIVIPEGVPYVPAFAFDGCTAIEAHIPDPVEWIGPYAFEQCENLKKVYLSSGIKNIGDYAFYLPDIEFIVEENSYAAEWALEMNANYKYPDSNAWLE